MKRRILLMAVVALLSMTAAHAQYGQGSNSSNSSTTRSRALTTSDLVYHPVGILPENLANYDLNYAASYLRRNTNWTITPEDDEIIVRQNQGLDLTYRGAPIRMAAVHDIGPDMYYNLTIHPSTLEETINIYSKLLDDLNNLGFQPHKVLENDNWPLHMSAKKGQFFVECWLYRNGPDAYQITFRAVPKD